MRCTKILELTWRVWLTTVLIFTWIGHSIGQENGTGSLLEFKYGIHFPFADMKDRFGVNSTLGAGFERFIGNKIYAGIDGSFYFGSNVNEDVLEGIRSFDGSIIGISGFPGNVGLKERGYYLGVNTGKIFGKAASLTGIRVQIGAGFLQHKIRVQVNQGDLEVLEGDKVKGYDRLTNGPAIHIAAGYQYQNPKNNLHFNITGDLFTAFTKSRRSFDNLTGGYLSGNRTDILAGISLAYIVSISRDQEADQIYY